MQTVRTNPPALSPPFLCPRASHAHHAPRPSRARGLVSRYDCRDNVLFTDAGELLYFVAAVAIVHNLVRRARHTEHTHTHTPSTASRAGALMRHLSYTAHTHTHTCRATRRLVALTCLLAP